MCLNMTQYVSIMPEYGLMSLNKPKKKNYLFPSERPGEICSDDAAGKFFLKQVD